jgi:hypothetical protein
MQLEVGTDLSLGTAPFQPSQDFYSGGRPIHFDPGDDLRACWRKQQVAVYIPQRLTLSSVVRSDDHHGGAWLNPQRLAAAESNCLNVPEHAC